jgi:acetaldehyde dehydrogenase
VLDAANPPPVMRARVTCEVDPDTDRVIIRDSLDAMFAEVAAYVPGYRLSAAPRLARGRVSVALEVEGAGDFLERYSGNLDIITAAAARVGDRIAQQIRGEMKHVRCRAATDPEPADAPASSSR